MVSGEDCPVNSFVEPKIATCDPQTGSLEAEGDARGAL